MGAHYQLWSILALAALVAGCRSEPTAPLPEPVTELGPAIVTDRSSYDWTLYHEARWVVRNPHGVAVYFVFPSDYVYLQRYDGGAWRDLPTWYGWALDQRLVHQVPAGDSLEGVMPLTNDVVPVSGWHRLAFLIYKDSSGALLWPLGNRVTPAVWIGPARGGA